MPEDLAAEQARLEREIAFLRESLGRAQTRLEVARAWPKKPRGLGAGIATGAILAVLMVVVGYLMMMAAVLGHD